MGFVMFVVLCLYTHPMLTVLLLSRFHQSQSRISKIGFSLLPHFRQSQFVGKYRMCVFTAHSSHVEVSDQAQARKCGKPDK